jgi:Abnormal spindle-like microcephaly-assoc'd, ASPM-SPD-2-Hydin
MDLGSRWDCYIAVTFLLLAIGAMAGCQGLSSGGSSANNSSVWATNTRLNFGTVVVGSSKSLTDTITNGSAGSVTISSVKASNSQYQVTSPGFPLLLAPGQSTSLTINFVPNEVGQPSGTIAMMMSSSNEAQLNLSVSGIAVSSGKLTVSPASLSFGSIPVGQSQAQNGTLTNSGGSSVNVTQASTSNAVFSITGLGLPTTLSPGQNTTFTVTFAPKTAGLQNASVSFNGAASLTTNGVVGQSSSPTSAILSATGNGTTAGQLTLSPTSLSFGNVPVHTSQNLTAVVTNSGASSATINQVTATGAGFALGGLALPNTLAPGQSASFEVTFTPVAAGTVTGTITISTSNSNLSLALTGSGVSPGALTASPASLNFGSVTVGRTQSQNGTITNSGGTSVTVSQASATGAGFAIGGITLPLTLSPGQSAAFTATFTPAASGNVSGNIAFTSSVATLNIPLTGSGLAVGSLGASPATINFGNVQVGSSQTQTVTLTNGGSSSVTVSRILASGAGFAVTGLSLPLTLAVGQSASFNATFTPNSAGSVNGSVAISSNAPNPSLNIALSGTGVAVGTLAANPATISFGSVPVGSSLSRSETLTNSGGSSISVSAATVTGAGFGTSGLNLPTTLSPGQSLTFNVTFTPLTAGSASGTLSLTASGSVPSLSISLSGTAAAPDFSLSALPSSLTIAQGSNGSSTISVALQNGFTGSVSLAASGLPSGVTASFGTNPITGTSGSTLTLTASSAATTGTSTVTITGTSGTRSHTTTVALTVKATVSALIATPTMLSFTYQIGSPVPGAQSISVTASASTLSFTASTSGGTWLSAAPISGTTPGTVEVTANPAGLTAGTYNGTVTIASAGATGSPQTVPVTLTVSVTSTANHYEYVFTDGMLYVYDLDVAGFPLVKSKSVPTSSGTRGAVACVGNATLYVSFGGDGGPNGNGGLLAYDLVSDAVVWTQNYSHGIDSHAITSDCTLIYMPDGELANTTIWNVVDAKTGNEIGMIAGSRASNPHNTIVFNGHVYLGGRQSTLFQAANVSDNTVYFTSANTGNTIRPFTLNAEETAAYITETNLLGFEQIDLKTGAVRFTVPVAGFSTNCSSNCPSTPSHGISMSPDEKWLYVLDSINGYVHVFDISGGVNVKPLQKFDVKLNHGLLNAESACAYDCLGDGWLHHSFDGRYVLVGDSGDVIDTGIQSGYVNPPKVVGFLSQMANSRKEIEIDFQSGKVVAAMTNRSSMGTGAK